MLETAREGLEGQEAWVVGGAGRDELLGRGLVDLDIAGRGPKKAARAARSRARGAGDTPGGRADRLRAAAADGRRLPEARRARLARAAGRDDHRSARPRRLARVPARGGLRREAPSVPGVERAAPV